jgi:hypothetical protein
MEVVMKVMRIGGGEPLEAFQYKGQKLELPEGQDKVVDQCGNQVDVDDYIVISGNGWLMGYDRGAFQTNFKKYVEPKEKPEVIHHPPRHIDLAGVKVGGPKVETPTVVPVGDPPKKKAPKKATKKKAAKKK